MKVWRVVNSLVLSAVFRLIYLSQLDADDRVELRQAQIAFTDRYSQSAANRRLTPHVEEGLVDGGGDLLYSRNGVRVRQTSHRPTRDTSINRPRRGDKTRSSGRAWMALHPEGGVHALSRPRRSAADAAGRSTARHERGTHEHDVSGPEKAVRRKRHDDGEHCARVISPTSIHCALGRPGGVQLRFGSSLDGSRQVGRNMTFGETSFLDLELVGTEKYFIINGNDVLEGLVGDEEELLPCESQTFIVVEADHLGRLTAEFFVFYAQPVGAGYSAVFIYNGLEGIDCSVNGVDVIGYDPELVDHEPHRSSVWRIGRNLTRSSLTSVQFPVGDFEFKTVLHGAVGSQCDFQLAPSITAQNLFQSGESMQYFVTIAGKVGGEHFSPQLLWCPSKRLPVWPAGRHNSQLVIINAYRSKEKTSIYMPFNNVTLSFDYTAVASRTVALRQGDCVQITNGNRTFRNIIHPDPITSYSTCIAVPEADIYGNISCYLHCHSGEAILSPPGLAEVFIYNSLILGSDAVVDVIAYGHHATERTLLSVLKNVRHGDGQSVLLPVGMYEFKVVYKDTIRTVDDFHNAPTLVNISQVFFLSQMNYYACLMGSILEPDYPPVMVISPRTTLADFGTTQAVAVTGGVRRSQAAALHASAGILVAVTASLLLTAVLVS
ncbi:uncharacterized protein LOC135808600 [Sycon ciliatum]|uniref:uncharacterized protein LOC135808600 n=1 Tax=Sycon ciliatum TaxID=27933 RepID=UPI0031F60E22